MFIDVYILVETTLDDHDRITEKFKDDDVIGAYAYLFSKLAELFDKVDFKKLKRNCTSRVAGYPEDFRKQMQAAELLDDILDILGKPSYCNWLNIRLLRRIVKLTEISEAQHLLDTYEKCLYSRKVSEVRPYFKSVYFDEDHFSKVEAKINRNAERIKVSDVIEFCRQLESDLKVPEGSFVTAGCNTGCFEITCVIPAQCAFYVNEMVKRSVIKFRRLHIQYFKIESFEKHFYCRYTDSSLSSTQCEL